MRREANGSLLRGCDLVTITVGDIALSGIVRDRAVIVQRKTGRPVQFEITEQPSGFARYLSQSRCDEGVEPR